MPYKLYSNFDWLDYGLIILWIGLENKVSFPLGSPDPLFNLDAYSKEPTVLPGGLAYPRYKVASVSFAASDVELHCLHSDMHFGPC
jgi:hypothetical protein